MKEEPDVEPVFSQRPVRWWLYVRSIEDDEDCLHRTLAVSGRGSPNVSGRDSRGFGPLWNRPDAGWQRPIAATGASGQ